MLPILIGVWLLIHQAILFQTPPWAPLRGLLGGVVWPVGAVILIGGCLAALGLFTGNRAISLVSCAVGILWFAWIGAFLTYSNLRDAPNAAFLLSFYGLGEHIYRFILLMPTSEPDEPYVQNW